VLVLHRLGVLYGLHYILFEIGKLLVGDGCVD